MRRQAIDDFFFEKKSQVLCKEDHGSIHITLVNYLGSMGPYEDICSQKLERMQGIKCMQV